MDILVAGEGVNAEMIFLKIVGAMFLAIAGRKILTPGV